MSSGMRGNMRIRDGEGKSVADMVKELKSAGIKVSHSTLRQILQGDTQMRTNAATNATQMATNANTVAAQREAALLRDSTDRRGQDITHEGHLLTNQAARSRLQYDMAKDQRDYATTRSDKTIEHNRNAREDAYKRAERYLPVDPKTGKVDEAQKGQFLQFADNYVSGTVNRLRNSKDPRDHAMAEKLAQQGIASMDDDAWNLVNSAWGLRNKQMASAGPFWGQSSANGSLNPHDYIPNGVDKSGMIDRVRNNAGDIAASRLKNPDGSLISPFSQSTASYDRVLQEARRQNPNWNGAQ